MTEVKTPENGDKLNPQDGNEGEAKVDPIVTAAKEGSEKKDSEKPEGEKKPKEGEKADDKKSKKTLKEGEEKPEGKDKPFYKKVGGQEFNSFEEYEKWALKNHGDLSNASGEIKRLEKAVNKKTDKEPTVDTKTIRIQLRADEFFENNPDAENYKEEMAVLLKKGKANNKNGRPSFKKAYIMVLKAEGKEIPVKKEISDKESLKNKKRIMRAGGGEDGGGESFNEQSEVDDLSNFADKAILG